MAGKADPGSTSARGRQRREARGAADRLDAVLAPYRAMVADALRQAITRVRTPAPADPAVTDRLASFYGQMEYHFGWRDAGLAPATARLGKLLRPVLLLLAYDLARSYQSDTPAGHELSAATIMPAAVAIELVHNFSLIHDDIEDGDVRRHHRPTLWTVWGQPQAINTGDGMFSLARLTLLDLVEGGFPAATVLRLAALLDVTCLRLCEGQYLDMSFEGQHDVTTAMYLSMIERKTAALMECALEIGARLAGVDDAAAAQYAGFGNCLGVGFQLRDDILGIWASDGALGKSAAGDLRRRKVTLPTIHALAHAAPGDRAVLDAFLSSDDEVTEAQVAELLVILQHTGAHQAALATLRARSAESRRLLGAIGERATPAAEAPLAALAALVDYIEADLPEPSAGGDA